MSVGLIITVDGAVSLEKNLNRAIGRLSNKNITNWFYSFADPYMRSSFKKNFMEQRSPSGTPWAEWSDNYKGGIAILRKTGGLMRSVTTKRGKVNFSFRVGNDRGMEMIWGAAEKGGTIKLPLRGGYDKFLLHQLGSKDGKLPSRPMVGFRKEDSAHLGRSLGAWITNQLKSSGL